MNSAGLGWIGIVRLGFVQAALGAIVTLSTSTLNRVMVVELALPAILPGALVALHYGVQVLRPVDVVRRPQPWPEIILSETIWRKCGLQMTAASVRLIRSAEFSG